MKNLLNFILVVILFAITFSFLPGCSINYEPEPTEIEAPPISTWVMVAEVGNINESNFKIYEAYVGNHVYVVASSSSRGGLTLLNTFYRVDAADSLLNTIIPPNERN